MKITEVERDWQKESDDSYAKYTRIMQAFDELVDAMEDTQPNDLTVVQRHDVGVYYNDHLKREIIRVLRRQAGTGYT
jgi:hypothetical protein